MAQHIFTGAGSPVTTPTKVGQHYIDTTNKIPYISAGTSSSADWKASATAPVDSVFGRVGAVVAQAGDYTAAQVGADPSGTTATHAALTNNPHAVTKSQVGLGNADNTSDVNKPVSTAQGAADTAVQNFSIARANHTGSQLASTISDFASTVLGTLLTGISFASGAAVTASDTILIAIGKLQAQANYATSLVFGTQYQYSEDLTQFVTTSATFVSAASFPINMVDGSQYRINVQFNFTSSSQTMSARFDLRVGGSSVISPIGIELKDPTDDITYNLFSKYVSATTGSVNVGLYCLMEGGQTVTVKTVKCDVWRVI